MNAVCFGGNCHVQPVVDQHFRSVWASDGNCLASELSQRSRAQIFFPNLNELATSGGGLANGFDLELAGRLALISSAEEGLAAGYLIKQRLIARQIQRNSLLKFADSVFQQAIGQRKQAGQRFHGI